MCPRDTCIFKPSSHSIHHAAIATHGPEVDPAFQAQPTMEIHEKNEIRVHQQPSWAYMVGKHKH